MTLVAAACTGTGANPDSATTTAPSQSDDVRLAESFVDAFYSWDPDALTDLPWAPDAYLGQITYYQGWAEAGNYKIVVRYPCTETAQGATCKVTVEDDLLLALGLEFHATDTFRLTIEDGEITAVATSSDDPVIVQTATDWLMDQKPELAEGPCAGFFDGGPTPGDCVRAVVQGFEEFAATQSASD